MKWLFNNLRYKLLAAAVALLLWGVSHSTSSIERGFDIPVAIQGLPEDLVVTGQSSGAVNIRVRASRAALRSLSGGSLEYPVDLSGAKSGRTEIEVDTTRLDLPRGAEITSRSPLDLDFTLERRATKSVKLRPDIEGTPAEGFEVAGVTVEPPRVRITGARSEVLRLSELLTETIDVTGAEGPIERTVKPSVRGRNVWIEGEPNVTVRIDVVDTTPEAGAEEKQG